MCGVFACGGDESVHPPLDYLSSKTGRGVSAPRPDARRALTKTQAAGCRGSSPTMRDTRRLAPIAFADPSRQVRSPLPRQSRRTRL